MFKLTKEEKNNFLFFTITFTVILAGVIFLVLSNRLHALTLIPFAIIFLFIKAVFLNTAIEALDVFKRKCEEKATLDVYLTAIMRPNRILSFFEKDKYSVSDPLKVFKPTKEEKTNFIFNTIIIFIVLVGFAFIVVKYNLPLFLIMLSCVGFLYIKTAFFDIANKALKVYRKNSNNPIDLDTYIVAITNPSRIHSAFEKEYKKKSKKQRRK